ncbi:MAG: UvrB/UvrC motif-containing protein [Verrucomicrobiota bacterium]
MQKCDVCNDQEATVFLTQIVDGKMQKVNLCQACADEKGVDDPTGFALADLLLGLGSQEAVKKSSDEAVCEECGFTQSDFKKTGRLGCAGCYNIFGDGLDSLLKAMHKGTRHVGKVPVPFQHTKELQERIQRLQGELDTAVADEAFETAASLRDEIKTLETEAAKAGA